MPHMGKDSELWKKRTDLPPLTESGERSKLCEETWPDITLHIWRNLVNKKEKGFKFVDGCCKGQ